MILILLEDLFPILRNFFGDFIVFSGQLVLFIHQIISFCKQGINNLLEISNFLIVSDFYFSLIQDGFIYCLQLFQGEEVLLLQII